MSDGRPYRIEANITRMTFAPADGIESRLELLAENPYRTGFIIYNESTNSIRIAFSPRAASDKNYTTQIGDETEYPYVPENHVYTGPVTYNPVSPGTGRILVTEFIKVYERR